MSRQLEEIMNSFNKYISIYVGLVIPENSNYDESFILSRIIDIALKNKFYCNELCNIIIEHLNCDEIRYKLKLFNIIDSLFKSVGKDYIDKLCKYLFVSFKECFTMSDFNDRILLFKIFYTWKYLVPKSILDIIRNDLKLDEFKEIFIKTNPGKIEKYDDFNKNMKLKIESMNNNNGNKKKMNINVSKKFNNNQNLPKKIISEKKYKEDNYQNDTNNDLNITNNLMLSKPKSKTKKSAMLSKKRKSSQDKSTEGKSTANKNKKLSNPTNNKNLINNNSNNISLETSNIINMNNINNNSNDIFINQNNLNNISLSILLNSGINLSALTNSLSNMNNVNNINNTQNNTSIRPQNQQQLLQNLLLNMITNNKPLFNSNQSQAQPSIIEYKIFQFLTLTTTKLNINLRFFSSLAKYYNETLEEKDNIDIKCKYEDIYNNEAYKLIRQKIDNKLFSDIKKHVCAICGFRTLFYNNLTEHLDIHFNINYLQMEGKNLFRKIGHNRNNWINGDNSKIHKNKAGYTLENLLYYKNMMNNNLVKINKEKEEDNEEFMIPIYEEAKESCYYCGDEFKKIFSTKYNYWFYNKVIPLIEEKNKYLIHQNCYDEMIKIFK